MSAENPNEKTDWSYVDRIRKKADDEKRAEMSPEERIEDDRRKREQAKTMMWLEDQRKPKAETPEERKQTEEELAVEKKKLEEKTDELIRELGEGTQRGIEAMGRRAYERIKSQTEQFRQKHGIEVSQAQLKRENLELRSRLGLK